MEKAQATWWRRGQAVDNFLDTADLDVLVSDLRIFWGPNAEKFEKKFRAMMERPRKKRFTKFTWNWWAFLFSYVWFFARKQYLWGAFFILLPVVMGLLGAGKSAGFLWVVAALQADKLYILSSVKRIMKARNLGLQGEEYEDYLRKSGGRSIPGLVLSATLFVLMLAIQIAAPIIEHSAK